MIKHPGIFVSVLRLYVHHTQATHTHTHTHHFQTTTFASALIHIFTHCVPLTIPSFLQFLIHFRIHIVLYSTLLHQPLTRPIPNNHFHISSLSHPHSPHPIPHFFILQQWCVMCVVVGGVCVWCMWCPVCGVCGEWCVVCVVCGVWCVRFVWCVCVYVLCVVRSVCLNNRKPRHAQTHTVKRTRTNTHY